jgi:hypothetical protein
LEKEVADLTAAHHERLLAERQARHNEVREKEVNLRRDWVEEVNALKIEITTYKA